jgi:hypothetical protein
MAPEPVLRTADRMAAKSSLEESAVIRAVRGSRPMGTVADLSNVYRRTLQGYYVGVNRVGRPVSRRCEDSLPRLAHLRHNPPAQGQHVIRFRKMGRIH